MRTPFIIKIPMGLRPWEADNWRAVSEALKMSISTTNKVDSPTAGLNAVKGKVLVDEYDSTPEYLENKIVEGSDIDFVQSNDGTGAKEIKVNLNVVTQAAEPSTITAGMLWHDTDARFGTPFNIGDGEPGIDYEVVFKGDTHEGSYTWMEDEDYLLCADDLLMSTAENIYFRDTAISINSADDGHLDLTADTTIDLNGVTLATDKIAFTQTDLNEYIDSLADGYIDYRATTGHRFGDGTNYAMFAADGKLTLTGTARVWKSVDINPQLVKLPGANPPAEDTIDGFGFHRYDRATEESVYITWIVPSDFCAGDASVRGFYGFVVDHAPVSPAAAENVRMGFEYKKIAEGEVFDFSTGTSSGYIDETIAADETAYIVHLTSTGTCTTTGWQPKDKILFRFYRDATAVEDTYDNEASAADNDVWVKAYHLEYLSDKLGGASS
jgi:hypothetical protein